MEQLKHCAAYVRGVNTNTRSVDVIASTEEVDSYSDVVTQDWRLERYAKNPIVLHQHDHAAPIGRAEDVGVRDGALQARLVFATTERAEEVWQLVQQRVLRGVSVGFRPGRVEDAVVEGRRVTLLKENILHEISVVAVPANASAVIRCKALGLLPQDWSGDASKEMTEIAHRAVRGEHEAPGVPLFAGANPDEGSAEIVRIAFQKASAEPSVDPFDYLDPKGAA